MGTSKDVLKNWNVMASKNRPALEAEAVHCRDQLRYWQSRQKAVEAALNATDQVGQVEPPPVPTTLIVSFQDTIMATFERLAPGTELKIGEIAEQAGIPLAQARSAIPGLHRKGAIQRMGSGLYRLPSDAPSKRRPAA